MRERIIDKMTQYVEGLLEKETIDKEEFAQLQSFLGLLDAGEWSKHSNERFTQAMGLLMGGRS
jgi:hypothetical protein